MSHALDDVQEGLTIRRETDQANGTARIRRVFRFSDDGSAFELDATLLGRVKFKKVP